jgi:hypothetical protein
MSKGGYKGDYSAPGHTASTVQGSYMSDDSKGVEDGLSARMDMDSENLHDFSVNNAVDPVSGNPRQCIEPRGSKSVKEKGHSFKLC